jgi:hypothetical protein
VTRDKQQAIDLTDSQLLDLKRYARLHGITVEQAATRLAQVELDARYRLRKTGISQVLPFKRR